MTTQSIVSITAVWGNGDAESTIKLSAQIWQEILKGAEHYETGASWYEGEPGLVSWTFRNGLVSIDGEDGMQCLIDASITGLIVTA